MNSNQPLTNDETEIAAIDPGPEPILGNTGKFKKKNFGSQGKGGTWKLAEHDKQLIVSLWASGLTPSECVDRAREEFNIEISTTQVLSYSRKEKWQSLIRKIRQETMSDLAAVSGSHKRVRLERHEKIFDRALKKGDLKNAIVATESQRKEMEGGGDTINMTLNQFNMLSDDELSQKHEDVLKKIQALSQKGVVDVVSTTAGKATGS